MLYARQCINHVKTLDPLHTLHPNLQKKEKQAFGIARNLTCESISSNCQKEE